MHLSMCAVVEPDSFYMGARLRPLLTLMALTNKLLYFWSLTLVIGIYVQLQHEDSYEHMEHMLGFLFNSERIKNKVFFSFL